MKRNLLMRMKHAGAPTMRKLMSCGLCLWLAGCNLTTDGPLFSPDDAVEVKLDSGFYATGTDTAYIKIFGGKTIVSTQTDNRLPYDAIAVDLGGGFFLLQYGNIDERARNYVLFRHAPDGSGIYTAVYDCSKSAGFFQNFGISIAVVPSGFCAMHGATKDNMLRAHRALTKVITADSWTKTYRPIPHEEGRGKFRADDKFSGKSR